MLRATIAKQIKRESALKRDVLGHQAAEKIANAQLEDEKKRVAENISWRQWGPFWIVSAFIGGALAAGLVFISLR